MAYSVKGTTITLTRGDSFAAEVAIMTEDGSLYVPQEGDSVRFAMKESYSDLEPLLVIQIPTDSLILEIRPEDTKNLHFGKYVYDIELTTADGRVDTFITTAKLNLTEEVH